MAPPRGAPAFVTARGRRFERDGGRHVFVGTNLWQGMNLAAEGVTGDRDRLTRELDRLAGLGVANVRVMAASEGPDSERYRMTPSLMAEPRQYNEDVFQGLDWLLDALARRGMYAVMVLNNFWHWSGGMAQYVSWVKGTTVPYPNDTDNWRRFEKYSARFYRCDECQGLYRAHIETVLGRRNTVNGRPYREDPTIFSWELANEPAHYPVAWIHDTAAFIKSIDSNHMVTTGISGGRTADLRRAHASPFIDYVTCHIWAENMGVYDPGSPDPANLQRAIDFAASCLSSASQAARELNKPLVLEEFGLARDGWSASSKLDPSSATTNRDLYFRALYDAVEAALAQGDVLAGDNFWAWGGEVRPCSAWTGDPPHEPAGWYSVYDADATTQDIVAAHAAAVRQYVG